jgi:membrane-associated HD superfamily phosphohydrolase
MCCTLLKKKQKSSQPQEKVPSPTASTTTSTLSSVIVPNEFTEKETVLVEQPETSQQEQIQEVEEQEQVVNYLLDPIEKEQQGRKCLVLDLDETLIHSSFKVNIIIQDYMYYMYSYIFRLYLRQILLFLLRLMAIAIMYLY